MSAILVKMPPQMRNDRNYFVSLSRLSRWLAERAEELGATIVPETAAVKLLAPANPADYTFVEVAAEPGAGILRDIPHPFAAYQPISSPSSLCQGNYAGRVGTH